ncbi:MAG TPA: PEGA domain-containing protein [Candidatus Saccharimonadales bacterium]|nr:PEGA domain-containing protein [Candidatus Saccharimonadales bacterium]
MKKQNKSDKKGASSFSFKKQLFIPLVILIFLLLGTILMVLYARGYRFDFGKGEPKLSKTGILNLTSSPKGAQVYVDGHPTIATDNSINLAPNKYTIKISKDGYNDWQKDVDVKQEEVTNLDAILFPKSPTLQSISTFGVEQALIDPTGTKLAFKIASQSARKNGVYIFDMTQRPLPILQGQSSSNQLADDSTDKFSESTLYFSPDGKELLASISASLKNPTDATQLAPDSEGLSTYYLLKTDSFNDVPQDTTAIIDTVFDTWNTQRQDKERAKIKSLKPKLAEFSKNNFNILSWSPDDKKILYQASASSQMPMFINPRRIGNNLRYERRDLKKGAIYVYDITEDVNTRIIDSTDLICTEYSPNCNSDNSGITAQKNPLTWFPDSEHLVYVHEGKINIVETDGSNMTTIYAGPFIDHYVFPWPDESKIVILTNLGNPSVSPTLYTIGLK